jgi:hypothetical protein
MPGAISPSIINGTIKSRKELNRVLKVKKIRCAQTGKKRPDTMPSTMAMATLASNPTFHFFMKTKIIHNPPFSLYLQDKISGHEIFQQSYYL